jgi:2',3'-cyclic-nucleotide 2'-phosphodiesterase (5'-nucleotidase family)
MKKIAPLLLFVLVGCSSSKQTIVTEKKYQYKNYRIEQNAKQDAAMQQLLKPYGDSIANTMNLVIGFSTRGLTKKQPESELGNFMADCMREMASIRFNRKVDAAFVNYGGIRSYIPKGNITVGKIYELMPFDNILIIQELRGDVFRKFLERVAERGGWPCSGIKMQIKNKKPVNVFVGDKPLDDNAIYVVANSDYVANGGDDCDMLKAEPQINVGYILRDAIIEFVKKVTKEGKPIDWKIDGRVTY